MSIYADPQSKCSEHLSKACRKACMKGSFRKGMMRSKKRCNTCVEDKRRDNGNCNPERAEIFKDSVGIDQMRSGTLMENLGKKFGSKEGQKMEYSNNETYDPPTLGEYTPSPKKEEYIPRPKKEEYISPTSVRRQNRYKKSADTNTIAAIPPRAQQLRGQDAVVLGRPVRLNREEIDPTLFTGNGMKGLGSWNGGGKKRRKKQTKRRRKKSKRTKRTRRQRR